MGFSKVKLCCSNKSIIENLIYVLNWYYVIIEGWSFEHLQIGFVGLASQDTLHALLNKALAMVM
jgi:hypothetical protein